MIVVINAILLFFCVWLLTYFIDGSIYAFKKVNRKTLSCLFTGLMFYVIQYVVANGENPNNFLAGILDKIVDAIFVYGIFQTYSTLNKIEEKE